MLLSAIPPLISPHSLNLSDLITLEFLLPGPQPMTAIAKHLQMSTAGANIMANKLLQERLITRGHPPGDRRAVHLTLTAKGRELMVEVTRALSQNLNV